MKKEHWVVFAAGLFILSYVLDLAVEPLSKTLALKMNLLTPYRYFAPNIMTQYPFTTASIFVKGLGIMIIVTLFLSFMEKQYIVKSLITLVLLGLMQLYSLQDLASRSHVISYEWDLGLTLGGLFLIIPLIYYLFRGLLSGVYSSVGGEEESFEEE